MTIKMRYQTVVFDMDGTLLDTLDDLADSTNAALRDCGYPERSREEVRRFVGNGVHLLIERAVPAGTDEAAIERCFVLFKEYYGKLMCCKTRPYEGILPLLEALHKNGVQCAVVSNKYDGAVKQLSDAHFGAWMDVAIGERAGVRRKPAPDSVLEALRFLGADAKTALYAGDSDVDVQTAHNAGLPCAGVTWGFRDRCVLEEAGADFLVDTPEQLLNIVMGLDGGDFPMNE